MSCHLADENKLTHTYFDLQLTACSQCCGFFYPSNTCKENWIENDNEIKNESDVAMIMVS